MSQNQPVNGHPNPFTLEPLDHHPDFQPLSAREVADIKERGEAEERERRNVAHRAGVRQSRDRAQYVRQQKGHSWLLHWVVLGIFTCFIVPIYYSVSPNHYWHI